LLGLDERVKELLRTRKIEMGHARALLSLSAENQRELAQQIVVKNLSVRETEKLVQKTKLQVATLPVIENPYLNQIAEWQDILGEKLSTSVKIQLNEKGEGKIVITVHSPNEIDWFIKNIR
jgi:ParB family chromosome partitioning protein